MSQPIIVTPTSGTVLVGVGSPKPINVAVGVTGPAGPPGADGPAGPPGPMGTLNTMELTFEEFQALPTKQPNTIYVII